MDTITDAGLYRLLSWLSPAFPVGSYAYSHGIERAVEEGLIADPDSLRRWIIAIVLNGAGRLDAGFFRAAWQAATDDDEALVRAAEWADAMRATRETALESAAQGQAFLDALSAAWPTPGLARCTAALAGSGRAPAYSVAVGVAAALAQVPLRHGLLAYLHAMAANLVSAGVRLVPLGQSDGQRALADLEPAVRRAADQAMATPFEAIGSAAPMVDWTSMQHETQYTRLFRS
ncbi:MAG TPA: urease accessory UreF family protein [Rhodospirillales bacterium]|jgi:urease accessory protein